MYIKIEDTATVMVSDVTCQAIYKALGRKCCVYQLNLRLLELAFIYRFNISCPLSLRLSHVGGGPNYVSPTLDNVTSEISYNTALLNMHVTSQL